MYKHASVVLYVLQFRVADQYLFFAALVAAMREPVFNLPRYCVKMNIQSQADKPKKEKTANPMCSMPYIIQQPMKANTGKIVAPISCWNSNYYGCCKQP